MSNSTSRGLRSAKSADFDSERGPPTGPTKRLSRGGLGALTAKLGIGASLFFAPACEERHAQLTLYTWWTDGGERKALDALIHHFEAQHPGITVKPEGESDSDTTRTRIIKDLESAFPPSTFQANLGADLMDKILFDGCSAEHSRLVPIETLEGLSQWTDLVRKPIAESLKYRGQAYAVPLNIHRLNLIYFNREALKQRFDPAAAFASLDQFKALALPTCAPQGPLFAVGLQNPDAIPSFLFENLLVAVANQPGKRPDYYQRFWDGCADPANDPEISQLLSDAIAFWGCVQPEGAWPDALSQLQDGRIASMGDWATASLLAGAQEFEYTPFPGTQNAFVYTTDTFPLTRGTRYPEETLEFLTTAFSIEGQTVFNRLKGSVPARDFPLSDVTDTGTGSALSAFQAAAKVDAALLATSGQVPAADLSALGAKLRSALVEDEPNETKRTELLQVLIDFYPRVVKWAWLTGRIEQESSPCFLSRADIAARARLLCLDATEEAG